MNPSSVSMWVRKRCGCNSCCPHMQNYSAGWELLCVMVRSIEWDDRQLQICLSTRKTQLSGMSPAVSLPCPEWKLIPPLQETRCVELVALVHRAVLPDTDAADREGHHVIPVEICQMRAVCGSACLQSDNLSFWEDALVLAGKIWIHWSTPLSCRTSIYQHWLILRVSFPDFEHCALFSREAQPDAYDENSSWWIVMEYRGGGERGCFIKGLPRRWQPRDGWAGAAPGLLRCCPCWQIQALPLAAAHESGTAALRNEAFRCSTLN